MTPVLISTMMRHEATAEGRDSVQRPSMSYPILSYLIPRDKVLYDCSNVTQL